MNSGDLNSLVNQMFKALGLTPEDPPQSRISGLQGVPISGADRYRGRRIEDVEFTELPMKTCAVGVVARLVVDCLDNPKGTLGICYEVYDRGYGTFGASFIFPNGRYDGFSPDEQRNYLSFVKQLPGFVYEFTNVIQLSRDFEKGVFNQGFNDN